MPSARILVPLLALLAVPAAAQDPVIAVISVEAGSHERVETPIFGAPGMSTTLEVKVLP